MEGGGRWFCQLEVVVVCPGLEACGRCACSLQRTVISCCASLMARDTFGNLPDYDDGYESFGQANPRVASNYAADFQSDSEDDELLASPWKRRRSHRIAVSAGGKARVLRLKAEAEEKWQQHKRKICPCGMRQQCQARRCRIRNPFNGKVLNVTPKYFITACRHAEDQAITLRREAAEQQVKNEPAVEA